MPRRIALATRVEHFPLRDENRECLVTFRLNNPLASRLLKSIYFGYFQCNLTF